MVELLLLFSVVVIVVLVVVEVEKVELVEVEGGGGRGVEVLLEGLDLLVVTSGSREVSGGLVDVTALSK